MYQHQKSTKKCNSPSYLRLVIGLQKRLRQKRKIDKEIENLKNEVKNEQRL